MSFQALSWAVRQKVGGVTGKAILLMLANYADRDGSCMPGQETLADECECSARAVREWLARFEGMNLIKREERRRSNGYRTSDRIILQLEADFHQPADNSGDQPAPSSQEQFSPENNSPEDNADLTGSRCRAIDRTSKGNRKSLISASATSPLEELSKVLDPEHAAAVVEHRGNLKAKFSSYAAKLLAAEFAKCPDPNAAADAMICNGWQGFKPEWIKDRPSSGPPPGGDRHRPPPNVPSAEYGFRALQELQDELERKQRHEPVTTPDADGWNVLGFEPRYRAL